MVYENTYCSETYSVNVFVFMLSFYKYAVKEGSALIDTSSRQMIEKNHSKSDFRPK